MMKKNLLCAAAFLLLACVSCASTKPLTSNDLGAGRHEVTAVGNSFASKEMVQDDAKQQAKRICTRFTVEDTDASCYGALERGSKSGCEQWKITLIIKCASED